MNVKVNMLPCGMKCVKYTLFFFNFLFAISGIALVGVGTYCYISMNGYNKFLEQRYLAPAITLIATGALVFIISFLGCYGAINEHINLLMAFSFLLLIIFILEVSVFTLALIYKGNFNEAIEKGINDSIDEYTADDEKAWDIIQEALTCCGSKDQSDWNKNPKFGEGENNDTQFRRPLSCCAFDEGTEEEANNRECYDISENIYKEGCLSKLVEVLQSCIILLLIVGLIISGIEIAAIAMACSLAAAIRNENNRMRKQTTNKVFVNNNNE